MLGLEPFRLMPQRGRRIPCYLYLSFVCQFLIFLNGRRYSQGTFILQSKKSIFSLKENLAICLGICCYYSAHIWAIFCSHVIGFIAGVLKDWDSMLPESSLCQYYSAQDYYKEIVHFKQNKSFRTMLLLMFS